MDNLNKKSLLELRKLHKGLTIYTKKQSSKNDIITNINNLLKAFDNTVNDSGHLHVKTDIHDMSAIDLRQAHQSFRRALQLQKNNKANIIQSFVKLGKELDFFMEY